MKEIEAAQAYIQNADPNHWLTKELQKGVSKRKIPHWAVKELVKKGMLDNSFMFEKKEEATLEEKPIQEKKAPWEEIIWDQENKKWIIPSEVNLEKVPPRAEFFSIHLNVEPFTESEFKLFGPLKKTYTLEDISKFWAVYSNQNDQTKKKKIYNWEDSIGKGV